MSNPDQPTPQTEDEKLEENWIIMNEIIKNECIQFLKYIKYNRRPMIEKNIHNIDFLSKIIDQLKELMKEPLPKEEAHDDSGRQESSNCRILGEKDILPIMKEKEYLE